MGNFALCSSPVRAVKIGRCISFQSDNFQASVESESMHEFEFYIAFASKLGGATGLNRIVRER